MKNKITVLCILILFTIEFVCCKIKIRKDSYAVFTYKQTQCNDAWQTDVTDSITLINVKKYLDSNNIYNFNNAIKQTDSAEFCLACTCKTGKTIYIT